MSTIFGSRLDSVAIFSCRVEMSSRLNVPDIGPSRSSHTPVCRFPSTGSPGAGSPASSVLSAHYDDSSSLPLHFVAFVPGYRRVRLCFAPTSASAAAVGQDYLSNGARAVISHRRVTSPPRFLGNPCVRAPLSDPGGPPYPRPLQGRRYCLPFRKQRRLRKPFFSRLYHAARTLPVYASQPGSLPDHATLGTGWWPTFTGSGLPPDWVTLRSFSYVVSLLHTILLLQALPGATSAEAPSSVSGGV